MFINGGGGVRALELWITCFWKFLVLMGRAGMLGFGVAPKSAKPGQ